MKNIIKVIYSDIRGLIAANPYDFIFGVLWMMGWAIISNVIIHYGCPPALAWIIGGPILSAFSAILLLYLFAIMSVVLGSIYDYICSVISRSKESTKE